MRILKEDITALVAEMLCLEHGNRAFDSKMQPLPKPHALWPTITIQPKTTRGLPYTIHCRPSVGVVFYILPAAQSISKVVHSVAAKLRVAGASHLCESYRTRSTTTLTMEQSNLNVTPETIVFGMRMCFKKGVKAEVSLPARLLLWTPPQGADLPMHSSKRAAFTWVFMPVDYAINSNINHIVLSSILYDATNVCSLDAGVDVDRLLWDSFQQPPPPPLISTIVCCECLIITPKSISLVKNTQILQYRFIPIPMSEKWNPQSMLTAKDIQTFHCMQCDIPLGGKCVVLRELEDTDGPVCFGECAADGVLLCVYCWNTFGIVAHRYKVYRTEIPISQSEVAMADKKYASIAPILAGTAAPFPEVDGAFIVTLVDGTKVILTTPALGKYSAIISQPLRDSGLHVIPSIEIVYIT